jgi:hypothetical protein
MESALVYLGQMQIFSLLAQLVAGMRATPDPLQWLAVVLRLFE